MSHEKGELRKKVADLESENVRLKEELEQVQTQLKQYRGVNESQKAALADKDSLLEQLTQVNESLKNDITLLKEIKHKTVSASSLSMASNPWADSSYTGVEPEQFRKLFIGGLNYETTEASLREYFEKFGEVEKAAVIYDAKKQSRGFGFIIYKASAMIDAAQAGRPHVVDERSVDTKRALPKEETDKPENSVRVNKLFVGGFNRETEDYHLKEYFGQYGTVECVEMLVYRDTGKKRGFAFVLFDDYDAVDKAVLIKNHVVNGSRCEVKKAVSRDKLPNRGPRQRAEDGGSWDKPRNFDDQQQDNRSNSNYGSGSGNYGSGSGNYGRNQGNFGGSNDGNIGNNQGNYGNYGRNSGDFNAGSDLFHRGGGNTGNYDNFGGNANNPPNNFQKNANNFGTSSQPPESSTQPPIPPEMAAMWSSFCSQYMGTMNQPANNSGGGPMRGNSHTQRAPGPYNNTGYGSGGGQDGQSTNQTN